jgi:hypothetical protein
VFKKIATFNEGVDLVAEVYDWFTEGFDATGWQEAKAPIEKLSH